MLTVSVSVVFSSDTNRAIARPIACGNKVPPQRTALRETPDPPAYVDAAYLYDLSREK